MNDQPETGITPGGTSGAFRDVLSKDHARRGKPPLHFADMSEEERIGKAKELGLPKFRVKQLANHYYGHFDVNAEEFSDFPAARRSDAAEAFFPELIHEVTRQVADGGTTIKTLWRLFDGSLIESVLMRYPTRTTLCISSQVGCGMGCPFCATGQLGLTRNMSAGEIVEQVRVAAKAMRDGEVAGGSGRLSNIVFMGMGEPMGNYKSVLSAVRQISSMPPEGFGISARNITVSTVGVVPGIRKLAEEGIPVRLAVSLHAPSDELRDELVPMNKRFNTEQVLDAAHDYYLASKRRVSIEYALMRGINDQAEHAKLLAKRLNHYGDDWAHVNPIPLNPIEGSKWTASKPEDERRFLEILHNAGITATLRDTRGQDIPCLDVDAGRVVKGVHFENLRDAGDPVELAAEYYRQGADELTFLDVTASSSHRQTMVDVVSRTAEQIFIPLTVGGGVRTPEDVDSLLRCGADKVGVNTAAINDPTLISRVAERFGNQVLVLSVDARREQGERHTQSGFEVTTMGGRRQSRRAPMPCSLPRFSITAKSPSVKSKTPSRQPDTPYAE